MPTNMASNNLPADVAEALLRISRGSERSSATYLDASYYLSDSARASYLRDSAAAASFLSDSARASYLRDSAASAAAASYWSDSARASFLRDSAASYLDGSIGSSGALVSHASLAGLAHSHGARASHASYASSALPNSRAEWRAPSSQVSSMSTDFGRLCVESSSCLGDSNHSTHTADTVGSSHLSESLSHSYKEQQGVFPLAASLIGETNISINSSHSSTNSNSERRRRGKVPLKKRTKMMRDVNFDPAPEELQKRQKYQRRVSDDTTTLQSDRNPLHRSSSEADVAQSLIRLGSPKSQESRNAPSPKSLDPNDEPSDQDISTRQAQQLQKLAESMKRTELSRRQLLRQRAALLERRLQARERPAPHSKGESPPTDSSSRHAARERLLQRMGHPAVDGRSAAFFAGSRGTLTDGLEESRRRLRMCADRSRDGR